MNYFNEIKEKVKNVKKKWKALKVAGGIISFLSPFLLILLLFIFLVTPLLLFIDKTASIFNPDGSQNNKKTFESAILKKEEHYNGDPYHVAIDKELILAFLLYGRGYDFGKDYSVNGQTTDEGLNADCDLDNPEACYGDTSLIPQSERKKLIKYANYLADGMVKEYYEYTCTHYEEKEYWDCKDDAINIKNYSPFDLNSYYLRLVPIDGGGGVSDNCTKVTKNVDVYTNYCGEHPTDNDSDFIEECESLCEPDQRVDTVKKYGLKTKDEYITWLKLSQFEQDEYGDWGYNLKEKLHDVKVTFPPGEEGEEKLDKIIEDIYELYELIKRSNGNPFNPAVFPDLVYTNGSFNGQIYAWNQCNLGGATIPYSGRSYCSGGCGLASTATIIGSLTGSGISPIEIGNTYCTPSTCVSGGTYGFDICTRAARANGLKVSGSFGVSNTAKLQDAIKQMGEGNSLMQMLLSGGSPTGNRVGHFIVITGFNADGTVTIADSGYPSNNNKTFRFEDLARYSQGMMLISR